MMSETPNPMEGNVSPEPTPAEERGPETAPASGVEEDVVVEPAAAPEGGDALAEMEAERDRYLDALQRLKAEFDNYRKRVDRDREAVKVAGVQSLVGDLLPIVDNLERALAASTGAHIQQILEGVEMVRGQLASVLAGRGVEPIVSSEGQPFDPEVHDAVTQVPSVEHDDGAVVHVVEKGYRMGDVVIRPAKVVVAARPPGGGG